MVKKARRIPAEHREVPKKVVEERVPSANRPAIRLPSVSATRTTIKTAIEGRAKERLHCIRVKNLEERIENPEDGDRKDASPRGIDRDFHRSGFPRTSCEGTNRSRERKRTARPRLSASRSGWLPRADLPRGNNGERGPDSCAQRIEAIEPSKSCPNESGAAAAILTERKGSADETAREDENADHDPDSHPFDR